jgi:hypothetical protein
VPEDDRELRGLNLGVAEMEVRTADGARPNAEQELSTLRDRIGERCWD